VHSPEPYLHRRTLLVGAVCGAGLLALGGCGAGTDDGRPTGPDPLEPVLAAAVYLADRYSAAMTALPDLAARLTPLRDAHRAHIVALTRELGTAESGVLPSGRPPAAPSAPAASATGQSPTGSPGISGGAAAAPSAGPLPSDRAGILADLKALERIGRQQAVAVCLAGPGYRAAMLGSIAAARASHVEALA
jgi:hypothetical protein